MINDHKRSEYQCQSTLIWTWLGEENYGNKRLYASEFQVGKKKTTFSKKFVNLKKSSNEYWFKNFPDTHGLFFIFNKTSRIEFILDKRSDNFKSKFSCSHLNQKPNEKDEKDC